MFVFVRVCHHGCLQLEAHVVELTTNAAIAVVSKWCLNSSQSVVLAGACKVFDLSCFALPVCLHVCMCTG